MRRVLIVSPHFPPDSSAGTHRVRLLAPHLLACDWEPTVVAVDPACYEGRLDPELAASVPAALRTVRVPAWPAATTRRLGVGDLGIRAFTGLRRACRELLTTEMFDALFITIYPSYPALLGPALKRRFGIPFVLDYQDPWVGSWGRDVGAGPGGSVDPKSRVSRALAERLEPRVVRAADAITAVSARTYEDVLARVADATPRACAAIPIGFDSADTDHLARHPRPNEWFDPQDGRVHLVYVGTVQPAGFSVIDGVFRALHAVRERSPGTFARLRLHFLGTSNQRTDTAAPRVISLARERGVQDVVHEVAPRLDYFDALNVQRQAHAVLLLGSDEPHYTPSKAFPALLSGRPILAVHHEASSVCDIVGGVDGVMLIAFGRPGVDWWVPRIADALEQLVAVSPSAPGRPLPPQLESWSARSLAARLAEVLDVVATPVAGNRPAA